MTFIPCVKDVLKPRDGAGICTPKVQRRQFLTATFHITLGKSCASATQDLSAELTSIWLSLSAIKVYELKPGSPYLSKALRAVKSLNYVMTHLILLGLEMSDLCAMPPRSTPCSHPAVPEARPQHCRWSRCCNCKAPAQHGRFLLDSGRGNLD